MQLMCDFDIISSASCPLSIPSQVVIQQKGDPNNKDHIFGILRKHFCSF